MTLRNPLTKENMIDVYLRTKAKEAHLGKMGYNVVTIWEHEYDTAMIQDIDMRTYIDSLEIETPLIPRDSLFGGRTEPFRMKYEVQGGRVNRYIIWISHRCILLFKKRVGILQVILQ